MTPYEMGLVSAFLIKHRKIEDNPRSRGQLREEKDLGVILREAPEESIRDLGEMLNGQGYELITLTRFQIHGIAENAKVYLLVRKADAQCPLLDFNRTAERMNAVGRGNVSAKIWFTQLWLLHLDLIYTQRDRSPYERNKWVEAIFTKEMLIQAVRGHINGYVRRLNPADVSQSDVYGALIAEQGADIERNVKKFLDLMCDCGMLEDKGGGAYRQSLLSAVEMKENFDRTLSPLMIDLQADGQEESFAAVAQPLLTRKPESEGDA